MKPGIVIPCIDVMGGKVVQLIQGERKALELDSPDEALAMFEGFPLLHVIDLNAALGNGDNADLVRYLLSKVRARVGGGVRTPERAKELTEMGADQVIVGTASLAADGEAFLTKLNEEIGKERVIVAVDVKGGRVAIKGWQSTIESTPKEVIERLAPHCAGFLCTYVDKEGMLQGTDVQMFLDLRAQTPNTLIAAGGITTLEEVQTLTQSGIDVALGMAVYTGKINIETLRQLS